MSTLFFIEIYIDHGSCLALNKNSPLCISTHDTVRLLSISLILLELAFKAFMVRAAFRED